MKGSEKGACCGFYSKKKGSEKGSEKGVSRRCLERPLEEYDPLGRAPYKGHPPKDHREEMKINRGQESNTNFTFSSKPKGPLQDFLGNLCM